MIVSWNWLADCLRLDMPVETLAERLSLTGLNCEEFHEVGGDLAIDLEVTSNRPDCLGHWGVAREIAVVFGKPPVTVPEPNPPASGRDVSERTSVRIDEPTLCSRFTARLVTGAKVGESPWRIRKRLETLGIRPINNIVDITNYVMLERGQPLHAYDFDVLAGQRLIVRKAKPGESLVAINQKTYALHPEMLAIADAERAVGLAGVMGGLDTEISSKTTAILIEAALFDPISVRKTSRALGLSSDASYRFERPMDPEATDWSSRRCAEMILDLAGGVLAPGVVDVGDPPKPREPIVLRLSQIERVLGIAIPRGRVEAILQALGLESVGELTFRPPSWRRDLEREIDLIEEAARIYGYEHIPEDRAVPLASTTLGRRERVENAVREVLTGLGFDEAYTFTMVSEDLAIPLQPEPAEPPLKTSHPIRKKENVLRPSVSPCLAAARRRNEAYGNPHAELFEIAGVVVPRPGRELPDEPVRLAIASHRDIFSLKGVVQTLLDRLKVRADLDAKPYASPTSSAPPYFTPGKAAELAIAGRHFGYVGELDRGWLDQALDMKGGCSVAELSLDLLLELSDLVPQHQPLSRFPEVARDLSLVVAKNLPWAKLASAVKDAAGPLLATLDYLDAFQGGNLPEDRQSIHFGMAFRHPERTLTGEEVERAVQAVVRECESRLQATLRS